MKLAKFLPLHIQLLHCQVLAGKCTSKPFILRKCRGQDRKWERLNPLPQSSLRCNSTELHSIDSKRLEIITRRFVKGRNSISNRSNSWRSHVISKSARSWVRDFPTIAEAPRFLLQRLHLQLRDIRILFDRWRAKRLQTVRSGSILADWRERFYGKFCWV